MPHPKKKLTKGKAKETLRHGEVRGHKLTKNGSQSNKANSVSTPAYRASGRLGRLS